jgi:Carboxypeptidase regulatory-like domain
MREFISRTIPFLLLLVAAAAFAAPPLTVPVVSPPLRSLGAAGDIADKPHLVPNFEVPRKTAAGAAAPTDTVVQSALNPAHSPDVLGVNFDGVGVSNAAPPDTTGRVGRNHYVQWVNTKLAVWDKSGHLLFGPVKGNTLFQSLGGTCATHNDGDPVAEYDLLADRWMLTQFAVGAGDGSFSHQCVAVSVTGDPLGSYYLYDFRTSSAADPALFVDYPHVGVWPDGYYVTAHNFGSDGSFNQALFVLDRERMLAGLPATYQLHEFGASAPGGAFTYGGALPADLDSLTPPPAGAPAIVVQHGSPDTDGSLGYVVHVWKVKTTWGSNPSLVVTGPTDVSIAPFNGQLCTATVATYAALGARPCVPQPIPMAPVGATPWTPADIWLDGVSDRLMYRVAYRNFGSYDSIVLNHTVNATGYLAGVRWYEIRNATSSPALYQQGTYIGATPDTLHRWMGSVAQDNSGNMLAGYTKSGPALLTEIDVAGRLANDPPGSLGPEIVMKGSGGSQILTGNRWGDYSTMTVDPLDGCTFWYTAEYVPSDGQFNWKTRIASFRYASCTAPPQGTISGVVTDCATGAPMSRALVSVSNGFSGATDANGRYTIVLPPGSYTVSASAPGRLCAASSSQSVAVSNGGTATKNFCLTGAPVFDFVSAAIDDSAASNNGVVNKDECVKLPVTIANDGCGVATSVTATLSTATPGVSVGQNKATLGTIARDARTTSTPFSFSTSSANGFQCGSPIDFMLSVASSQGASTLHFSVPTCAAASIAKAGAIDAGDPQQAARLGRDSSPSSCAVAKACPASLGTGTRSFDTYTFANTAGVAACVTVDVTADASCSGNNQIFSAAYLDSYDPQNLCTNYLADEGQSPDLGYNAYSFEVPAGRTFVVVVDAVSEGGVCAGYNVHVSGLVDNATSGNGACVAPPATNCLDDTDPQIGFGSGWHLVNDADASGGHFRMSARTDSGTAASLAFSIAGSGNGALVYSYAKSAKGGSADVYIDGAFRETISFLGTAPTRTPQLGVSARYAGLSAGAHTFELRNLRGGTAYVDGICIENGSSSAQPAAGPGATTSGSGNAGGGQSSSQSVAVPAGAQSLSILAEAPAGIPIQLVVLDPNGLTLATSAPTTTGLATVDVPASQSGTYIVQTINLSLGPVALWTAATPLVSR